MVESPLRQYLPEAGSPENWARAATAAAICPFGGIGADEDTLGQAVFGSEPGIRPSRWLGWHHASFAAWVTSEQERMPSSSGGLTTWFLKTLLQRGLVDGVVCVSAVNEAGTLFKYTVVRQPEDLERCRKSRYYPVEMSHVLQAILEQPGKYAVSALPCFAKGLRLAMRENAVLRERIRYIAGLFCGHLKTKQYALYLARRCGVRPDQAFTVDFRTKVPGRKASEYVFEVGQREPGGAVTHRQLPMSDVALGNWGLNGFMLKACECCDDVVGELADISFGDAWVPEYAGDYRGTNIVICRRRELLELLEEAQRAGEIQLAPMAEERVRASQDAGFRQRRQGLAYRLHLARKQGEWRPPKRVQPDAEALAIYARVMQHVRIRTAAITKRAYAECERDPDLDGFHRRIRFWVAVHDFLCGTRALFRKLLGRSPKK
jgi:coenzyme F420-reducing hydrogenase beta subunit